jgi:hypothetical protein
VSEITATDEDVVIPIAVDVTAFRDHHPAVIIGGGNWCHIWPKVSIGRSQDNLLLVCQWIQACRVSKCGGGCQQERNPKYDR